MRKLLMLVWSTAFSYFGWWIGAKAGIMTAFILSMVGLGFGMWFGRKHAMRLEEGA
jgi:hypothetical protein